MLCCPYLSDITCLIMGSQRKKENFVLRKKILFFLSVIILFVQQLIINKIKVWFLECFYSFIYNVFFMIIAAYFGCIFSKTNQVCHVITSRIWLAFVENRFHWLFSILATHVNANYSSSRNMNKNKKGCFFFLCFSLSTIKNTDIYLFAAY